MMPATTSAYTRCTVRLYPQMFVGGLMSYLWLVVYSGVKYVLSI